MVKARVRTSADTSTSDRDLSVGQSPGVKEIARSQSTRHTVSRNALLRVRGTTRVCCKPRVALLVHNVYLFYNNLCCILGLLGQPSVGGTHQGVGPCLCADAVWVHCTSTRAS